MHAAFAAMGMAPPGPGLRLYKPISGASARLSGTTVTITMQMPAPSDAYEYALTENDAQFTREIGGQGGIMLTVTYAVDPSSDGPSPPVPRRAARRTAAMQLGRPRGRPLTTALRYPLPAPGLDQGEPAVPGPRDYTSRTLMSLAHLSGALCYWPGCPEPVLREVNGQMHRICEIAHIRGAYPGSARYDAAMTDDQRRDLANLILLCNPHHDEVDAKEKEAIYPPEVMYRWKALRESVPREALKRLREVTPAGLRKIVAEGLQQRDARLLSALGRLESSDREAAALMRNLVDELTEAYARRQQGLDPDLVVEFSAATRRLTEMSDLIEELSAASIRIHDSRRYFGEY